MTLMQQETDTMEQASHVTHVCLFDDTPTSIISPIIDASIPSHHLVLLYTPQHSAEAKRVQQLANTRGYTVTLEPLPDTQDLPQLRDAFLSIFGQFSLDREIWLNISNGSRYHTALAYDAARLCDAAVYTIDPETDALQWLHPDDRPPIAVQDRLKLHEYFSLYNYSFHAVSHNQGVDSSKRELGTKWATQACQLGSALAKLNYLAGTAQGADFSTVTLDKGMRQDPYLQSIIDDIQALRLAEYRDHQLHFLTPENHFFCHGGWLEEYVTGLLFGLRAEIRTLQDIAHGAVIERTISGKRLTNELDAVALVNNKLHLIECKTKRFAQGSGSATLYKLDSLNELMGGINGRAALVSFQPLSDAEKLRAKELHIAVMGPEQLKQLDQHLKRWIREA